ncbi:Ran guanine nucleotide release factor [Brachionus plicatilis]|uniref:Ran guanine nucleotide release factor n=1 Tax=Brachionus plicatilis TaxID=10195 RepID=A0A3M7Q212_BRAPC|nr:Ran guanine nucleotide release factor [Brachionus plicatilis]
MSELQKLYGGSIYAFIPPGAVDISKMRQVPDSQEVFAHASTDQSIIFDILEYLDEADEEACRTHFNEIAGDSEAKIKKVDKLGLSPINCEAVYYLNGEHYMSKFRETAKNLVEVHMAIFRFKDLKTDILITFNDPILINPESSSAQESNNNDKWTTEQFLKTIETFYVADFSLFG